MMGLSKIISKIHNFIVKTIILCLYSYPTTIPIHGGNGNTLLHCIEENDDEDIIEFLIKIGHDVNARNNEGNSSLAYAVRRGRLKFVEALLRAGAIHDNGHFAKGIGPLHMAAEYGYYDIVTLLLKNGADVNAVDCEMRTPLHFAVRCESENKSKDDYLKIVKALYEAGADVNAEDENSDTPLAYAVMFEFEEGFEYLWDKGAIIRRENYLDSHLLFACLYKRNFKLAKRLVEIGADFNYVVDEGLSAFHAAVMLSATDIVDYMLKNGADLEVVDDNGNDPLSAALPWWCSSWEHVHESSRDRDHDREIELDKKEFENQMQCLHMLIEHGINLNRVNNSGLTPLYIVLSDFRFHSEIVRVLLKNGARFDFANPIVRKAIKSKKSKFPHLLIRHVAMFEAQEGNKNKDAGPKNFKIEDLNQGSKIDYVLCRHELELMKSMKIYRTNVSYFHLLVNRDIGPFLRNENVRGAFVASNYRYMSKRFPIYKDLLIERFSKELDYQRLVARATKGLAQVLNLNENSYVVIFNVILGYLGKKELSNLADVVL